MLDFKWEITIVEQPGSMLKSAAGEE